MTTCSRCDAMISGHVKNNAMSVNEWSRVTRRSHCVFPDPTAEGGARAPIWTGAGTVELGRMQSVRREELGDLRWERGLQRSAGG